MDKMINNSIANSGDKKSGTKPAAVDDLPIYDDVGDYVPNLKKNRDRGGERDRDQDRGGDRDRKSRFEDKNRSNRGGGGSKYFDKEEQDNNEGRGFSGEDKEL